MGPIEIDGVSVVDFRGRLPVRLGVPRYPRRPLDGISMAVIHGAEKCGMPLTPEEYDGEGNSVQRFSRCEMRWDKVANRVWVSFD